MKILISERQYANLTKLILDNKFIITEGLKKDCGPPINYKLSKVIYHGNEGIPPNLILKNPFNDGYDYQWRIWENCQGDWIRRSTKYRGENNYDLYTEHVDMTLGKNKSQLFIRRDTVPDLWQKLYNKINEMAISNAKYAYITKEGGAPSIGFSNNIRHELDGKKFREYVHAKPARLTAVNNYLKQKGLTDGFSKTGGWNTSYMKHAWDAPYLKMGADQAGGSQYATHGQITMTIGDYFTKDIKSKESLKSDVDGVKDFMKQVGLNQFLTNSKIANAKTGNQVYAYCALYAIREINSMIAQKTITGTNGYTDINVLNKTTPGFYHAPNFSVTQAKFLNSKKVCTNLPVPYVCYLDDFYFNFTQLEKHLDDAFKSDKYAVKTSLFPDGVWSFYTTYYGSDNYTKIYNSAKNVGDICNGIQSIDPKGKQGVSLWDPSTWGISSSDIVAVGEFLLPFVPVIGPYASAAIQLTKSAQSFSKGDYIDGSFRLLGGIAPFVKSTSIVNKVNKNLPNKFVSVSRYVPPQQQTTILKMGEKLVLKQAKGEVEKYEKQLMNNVVNGISDLTAEADKNIQLIQKAYPTTYRDILKDIGNGKKSISSYIT